MEKGIAERTKKQRDEEQHREYHRRKSNMGETAAQSVQRRRTVEHTEELKAELNHRIMRKEENINIQRPEEGKNQARNRRGKWKTFSKFSLLLFFTWDRNIIVLKLLKAQENLYPSSSLKNPH